MTRKTIINGASVSKGSQPRNRGRDRRTGLLLTAALVVLPSVLSAESADGVARGAEADGVEIAAASGQDQLAVALLEQDAKGWEAEAERLEGRMTALRDRPTGPVNSRPSLARARQRQRMIRLFEQRALRFRRMASDARLQAASQRQREGGSASVAE